MRNKTDITDEQISVVIPYSPEHTPKQMLSEAKESINKQNVATKTIVVTDSEQNGPAWARNEGLKRAESRYVAFLDADDLWKKNKLTRQLTRIQETGTAICVEGDEMETERFIKSVLGGEISSVTSSILLDTKKAQVQFEESLDRREDHLFILESASQGGVCLCNNLVEIRKHSKGLSSRDTRDLENNADRFERLVCERVGNANKYMDVYYAELYHQKGRREYFDNEFARSSELLMDSLSNKVRLKTIGALILSISKLTTEKLRGISQYSFLNQN